MSRSCSDEAEKEEHLRHREYHMQRPCGNLEEYTNVMVSVVQSMRGDMAQDGTGVKG